MKPITFTCLIAAILMGNASIMAQTTSWTKGFATTTLENLTTDADGNVYAASYYSEELEIDGTVITPANDNNSWLAKFNGSGDLQWLVNITSTDYAIVTDVRINASQQIVICGVSFGEVDFTGQLFGDVGDTQARGFIAVYDQTGICIKAGGTNGETYVAFTEVEPAPDGSYFVSGQADGAFYFAADEVPSYGDLDAIYGKFDEDLDPKWMHSIGDIGADAAVSLTLDTENNLILAGYHDGTFLFNGLFYFLSYGGTELFISKINAAGDMLWVRTMGSAEEEGQYWLSIETDADDNIYFSGNMLTELFHPGGTAYSYGETDMFVTSLTPDGFYRWFMHGGGAEADISFGMAKGNNDNLYIYGYFTGAAEFDGLQLLADVAQDGFICELGTDGYANFVMQTEGDDLEWTTALTVDENNNLICGGYATSEISIGGVDVTGPDGVDVITWLAKMTTTYTIPDVSIEGYTFSAPVFTMYPNPAVSQVTFQTVSADHSIDLIQIRDLQGNIVMLVPATSTNIAADVSELSPGCYIAVPFTMTGEQLHAEQLVVVH